jgi:hypothetical protein
MRIEEHYAICGYYLLNLYCQNSVQTQLNDDIQATRRGLSPAQIPQTHSIYEYEARAQMGVAALGGCEALNRIVADWNANLGSGVMRRKVVPLPEKRRRVIKSKTPPIKAKKPGIKRPK